MNFYKEILRRNALMTKMGTAFLILAVFLGLCASFNKIEVLGINAMIKPLKFALSIWIYAWTMAYLLYYVNYSSF
jgi:Na+-transporting NADH:ubiquinone oxidoreductase subunit NqrE